MLAIANADEEVGTTVKACARVSLATTGVGVLELRGSCARPGSLPCRSGLRVGGGGRLGEDVAVETEKVTTMMTRNARRSRGPTRGLRRRLRFVVAVDRKTLSRRDSLLVEEEEEVLRPCFLVYLDNALDRLWTSLPPPPPTTTATRQLVFSLARRLEDLLRLRRATLGCTRVLPRSCSPRQTIQPCRLDLPGRSRPLRSLHRHSPPPTLSTTTMTTTISAFCRSCPVRRRTDPLRRRCNRRGGTAREITINTTTSPVVVVVVPRDLVLRRLHLRRGCSPLRSGARRQGTSVEADDQTKKTTLDAMEIGIGQERRVELLPLEIHKEEEEERPLKKTASNETSRKEKKKSYRVSIGRCTKLTSRRTTRPC